jgi:hypothetical protein
MENIKIVATTFLENSNELWYKKIDLIETTTCSGGIF